MKKWDGVESPSTYIFFALCFYFGLFLLTALTIGQVKVDYSEGPGWSPFSRLPDGCYPDRSAASGAASTDNLLFAYSMGLLAWAIGYVGGTGVMRGLNPWWAIVPSGAALLLNLSYSTPDLWGPFVSIHLLASIGLLVRKSGR